VFPLVLFLAACAVTPKLDPGAVGTVPPEEKFLLTTDGKQVTVDHLRVGVDSVWARTAPADTTTAPLDFAVARASVTDLRRSYTGTPDVELIMLPVVLLIGAWLVLMHGLGGSAT
jgi:hypothetical protein